ncbi:hypothetical protein N2152v2_006293 [Parachlorella kessleri]
MGAAESLTGSSVTQQVVPPVATPGSAGIRSTPGITSSRPSTSSPSSVAGAEEGEILPFAVYDPQTNADYWGTRPVTVFKRGIRVGTAMAGWVLDGLLSSGRVKDLGDLRADKLLNMLTSLGPAAIKVGQAVSSRPDLVPPEYLRELEKLQDQIPPFPTDQALRVIQQEYGVPASTIFANLSPEPLAAASLGQVYKATLRSTGQEVAVKVQRPGVAASIALDVYIMRRLAAAVRRYGEVSADLPALLDGWAASLFTELDYRIEASNGAKFKELYARLEDVYIPEMNLELTTRKVLVMEWVDGERLRTAYTAAAAPTGGTGARGSNDDLRLVEVGVRCSLEQMLEEGFYHADPHPGNLLRTQDGRLAYLDFGMMGQIDGNIRRALIRATLHLVNREFEALADDFIALGLVSTGASREEIVPALTGVFEEALKGGVSNLSFGELSGNLGRTMYELRFQIPSYYTLLVRSLSVLEGIALASDPNYKVLASAYPWVARRLLTEKSPELRETLRELLYKEDRFDFERMESLMVQALKPVGRRRFVQPVPAAAAGAGDPGATPPPPEPPRGDALALLLSADGEFVRAIVTEELAKGIDAAWRVALDTALGSTRQELLGFVLRQGSGVDTFTAPPFSTALARLVLESLTSVPRLADERDDYQVEGIMRLARVLQESSVPQQRQQKQQEQYQRYQQVSSASSWYRSTETGFAAGSTAGMGSTAGSGSNAFPSLDSLLQSLDSTAGVLRWITSEMEFLTPEERAEALRLPGVIAQGVASRIVARLVRYAATSSSEPRASPTQTTAGTAAQTAARREQVRRARAEDVAETPSAEERAEAAAAVSTAAAGVTPPSMDVAGDGAALSAEGAERTKVTVVSPAGVAKVTTASGSNGASMAPDTVSPVDAPEIGYNGVPVPQSSTSVAEPAPAVVPPPAGSSARSSGSSPANSGKGAVVMRQLSTSSNAETLKGK